MIRFSALLLPLTSMACLGGDAQGLRGDKNSASSKVPRPVASLRRLTDTQYANSILALLGGDVVLDGNVKLTVATPGVLQSEAASNAVIGDGDAYQYDLWAEDLANQRFATDSMRSAFVGCTPVLDANDACIKSFVSKFGRQAFRRPLTSAEQAQYSQGVVQLASDGNAWTGMRLLTAAFLESPEFLYRDELGTYDASVGGYRLSSYQLASRLAFFLTNAPPDQDLMDSAASGALDSDAGVQQAAEALLQLPAARAAMNVFLEDWLSFGPLEQLVPSDPNALPGATPTLGASMRQEFEQNIGDRVFDHPGNFLSLLDANTTFVNQELAKFYGLDFNSGGQAWQRVTWPSSSTRQGLLMSAAYFAAQSHGPEGSATRRGLQILKDVLCRRMAPPPAGAGMFSPGNPNAGPSTARQKLAIHRSQPACAGCHNQMDPLGLSFEHFTGYGVYRVNDSGLDIDTAGTLDGVAFQTPLQLETILRNKPETGACIAQLAYRQGFGEAATTDTTYLVDKFTQSFATSGYDMQHLMLTIATSEAFRINQEIR